MSLLLFDIDGTLLLSGGAGMRAMARAFEATFGVADAFKEISPAGHTDTYLVAGAFRRLGISDVPESHARFREAYVAILEEEIVKPGNGRHGTLAGVEELLDALAGDPRFHLALLTGNYEPAARIKLAHFEIHRFFEWGAFGEESADRNDLARAAMERARLRDVPAAARERAVVIGDTPHDIACARAAGVRVVAVATGHYSLEALEAARPDVAPPDLTDTARLVELLR